jgi:protein-S-isoprenylcysteine O-methyltransferase Ste14
MALAVDKRECGPLPRISAEVIMIVNFLDYRPPRIAMLCAAMATIFHWLLPAEWKVLYPCPVPGLAGAVAGFGIMMGGWGMFRRVGTDIRPTGTASTLVTNGIYGYTRNPMYLGMFVILVSLAVALGSLAFYIAALVFFLIINSVFCPYEEAGLREIFGEDYTDYTTRVRRWL